jgi:hypothetical protein
MYQAIGLPQELSSKAKVACEVPQSGSFTMKTTPAMPASPPPTECMWSSGYISCFGAQRQGQLGR